MRKPLTWVVLAVFLLAGVLWLTRDEPESDESRIWQDWHDHYLGQPGQAWLWLMGLTAPAGERPDDAGRQWLEQAAQELLAAEDPASAMLAGSQLPWHDRRLSAPEAGSLAPLLACRELAACEDIDGVLAEHAELLARFRDWPVQTQTLHVAAPDSRNLPALQALINAAELDRLAQLSLLLQGQADQARTLAEHADRQLRAMLAEPPNLLVLMVGVRLLADQTAWLLALHRDGLIELRPDEPMLAELSGRDYTLQATLRGEFGLSYRQNHAIDVSHLGETDSWWERFQFRWLFKPQMLLNRTVEIYRWAAALDQPSDLSALARGDKPLWETPRQLRNLFAYGTYHWLPGPQSFLAYVGRWHDLSAGLALARAWLSEPVLDQAALQRMAAANPYGEDYSVKLDEPVGLLCYDGPHEDSRQFRCIRVVEIP